jgi:N-acetylmuramic acid 6-phosphate etherase
LGILDASECPPTFGTDPREVVGVIAGGPDSVFRAKEGAEDDGDAGRRAIDEQNVTAADSVVGIAASRRTPFVQAGLARARAGRSPRRHLQPGAPAPRRRTATRRRDRAGRRPEVAVGSTRMKPGTAQKMVLNMITTAGGAAKTLGNDGGSAAAAKSSSAAAAS